jgi:hypothetical protein
MDHFFIPVPTVPRKVDVGTTHETAALAQREISALLGIARIL